MGWRKLLGMEAPTEPDRRSAPALHDSGSVFAIDRDRMFDLELTSRLHRLFEVPRDHRDAAWTAAFFASVWNASLEIADPPFFEGPDGFVYGRGLQRTQKSPRGRETLRAVYVGCGDRI